MKAVINFLKKEAVLSCATILAVISMFIVPPDREYVYYIDFRTIGLLFALMAVVSGFVNMGVMRKIAVAIIRSVSSTRLLASVLWGLCFFTSMVITNDVALITFVPLSISVLTMCGKKEIIIYTVVLQTVAANLGSMLTPMGNPQNLYIYNYFNIGMGEFFSVTLPVIVISFILLVIATFFVKNEKLKVSTQSNEIRGGIINIIVYIIMAVAALLAVVKVVDYRIAVVIAAVIILIFDRKNIKSIDWLLLITFCAFFIFVGNVKRIEGVNNFISNIITGREFIISLFASQIISNVPASVMLSGFTNNYRALILGTDIGGLGTLVASLASLISFKLYSLVEGADIKKYLFVFSVVNVIFLIVLVLFVSLY